MDNLSDWLYIVFLIVAVVGGLLNSGKKKRQATAKPFHPQKQQEEPLKGEQEKSFWELLEEMQNGPQPKPKPQPAKFQRTEMAPSRKPAPPQPFLTAEREIPRVTARQEAPVLLEEESDAPAGISTEDLNLRDWEEVRKAIVYSEILHKKY
ncbi:MAG: hypothetical protein PHG27_06385 [Massilibacteroides sp.]|nr:hypothetical protein [Massilibacteroides sp.]MDD4115208.1 hypothetical protein [Massilibacteroides sp.]MDD4660678.1 hypothetical protein [Massilibacteroides sp.]